MAMAVQQDDLDVTRIALISVISVLATVAIVLFLLVLVYGFRQRQLASPVYNQLPAEMVKYVAEEEGKLQSIQVVDAEREVATVPIDTAMKLVVSELSADPQAVVTGVPAPPPPPETDRPADAGAVEGPNDTTSGDAAAGEGGERASEDAAGRRSDPAESEDDTSGDVGEAAGEAPRREGDAAETEDAAKAAATESSDEGNQGEINAGAAEGELGDGESNVSPKSLEGPSNDDS
jgi:hypothetical protein